jgi:hypothetical protein
MHNGRAPTTAQGSIELNSDLNVVESAPTRREGNTGLGVPQRKEDVPGPRPSGRVFSARQLDMQMD